MSETFSCNVRTRHGEAFVILTKGAVRSNDAASGLSVELRPRTHAPNVTEKGFFDLSVKFLLGLYPNIDSTPSVYSFTQASLIMRQKLTYIENIILSEFVM